MVKRTEQNVASEINKLNENETLAVATYISTLLTKRISKSKDNAPTDPEELLTQYAPDAIRFWTASGTLGHDIAFSPEQIMIGQKLLTKKLIIQK